MKELSVAGSTLQVEGQRLKITDLMPTGNWLPAAAFSVQKRQGCTEMGDSCYYKKVT
jgi:hypothetical protein